MPTAQLQSASKAENLSSKPQTRNPSFPGHARGRKVSVMLCQDALPGGPKNLQGMGFRRDQAWKGCEFLAHFSGFRVYRFRGFVCSNAPYCLLYPFSQAAPPPPTLGRICSSCRGRSCTKSPMVFRFYAFTLCDQAKVWSDLMGYAS